MNTSKKLIIKGIAFTMLTLCMMFAPRVFIPGGVLNVMADEYAAKIGDTGYATLKDAVNAVDAARNKDTITLQQDVVLTQYLSIPAGKTVTIDLNGKTINRGLTGQGAEDDGYAILVQGNLILEDSSDDDSTPEYDGTGKITGGNNNRNGGGLYIDSNAQFTMNGGSINDNTASGSGGGVYIDSNAQFTMNGGNINGNTAAVNGGGLSFWDTDNTATFTMNDGSINDNTSGYGGGVYFFGKTFTMNGGKINGNHAAPYGGGVCIEQDATFMMTGGEICGNTVSRDGNLDKGGGVYITGTDQTQGLFIMTGGRITGNHAKEGIGAGIHTYGKDTFRVSGNAVVSGNYTGSGPDSRASDVNIGNAVKVIGSLGNDAAIYIENPKEESSVAVPDGGYTSLTESDAGRFFSDEAGYVAVLEDNKVVMKVHTIWEWLKKKLNNASGTTEIRLNCDAVAPEDADGPLEIRGNADIRLDLNGHKIDRGLKGRDTKANGNVITVNGRGSLTVSDSSIAQTGLITGGNNKLDLGSGNKRNFGGGVCIQKNGLFTLKGGSISGNSALGYGTVYGGGVYIDNGGSFTMEGGSLACNSALQGGGVYIDNEASFTMNGGSVDSNNADIAGGVYINNYSTFTMNGGSIAHNSSATNGGGVIICSQGKLNMTEGSISGNKAKTGGGVYIDSNAQFTMNGGSVDGNSADENGGGVYIHSANQNFGTFTMNGGSINGNSAKDGAGVYNAGNFSVSGRVVISSNVANGSPDVNTGLYTGGKTNNIYLPSGQEIHVTGALTEGARLGVTINDPGTFACGYGGYSLTKSDFNRFINNTLRYDILFNNSGNAAAVPHNFTYTASGTVITATCDHSACTLPNKSVKLTLVKPKKAVYDDANSAEAKLEGLEAFNEFTGLTLAESDIEYVGRGDTAYAKSTTAPAGAGEYTASITADGAVASVDYSIAKVNIPESFITAPAAGTLEYKGSAQDIITAGSVKNEIGKMQYALVTDDSTMPATGWRESVPAAVDAGRYYVWYKVTGDDNHNDVEAEQITVTILPKDLTITADAKSKLYGEKDPELTYTSKGLVKGDKITGSLTRKAGEDIGSYAIEQGTLSAGNNYKIIFTGAALTIVSDDKDKPTDKDDKDKPKDEDDKEKPQDKEEKDRAEIICRKTEEISKYLTTKEKGTVFGIYQNIYDTVKSDITFSNGKIAMVAIDKSSIKDGTNYLTLNTGTRIVLGEKYTVSDNFADPKDFKKAQKFVKSVKKTGDYMLDVKQLKSAKGKSYELVLVADSNKNRILVIDVVDVSLNKKDLPKTVLTKEVSETVVSANSVSENCIGETGYIDNDGVLTISTMPHIKSGIAERENRTARFNTGVWSVAGQEVGFGKIHTIEKGKVKVYAMVKPDGTLSIGKVPGSGKGSVAITYTLNGQAKITKSGVKFKSKVYKTKVKVQL